MKTKVIEIRDNATCIPALAIKMEAASPIEDKFLWRCGYPRDGSGIVLMHLGDQRASSDPYDFPNRTMRGAHLSIIERWDELKDGDVVDVRVFLGEADTPAEAEIWTRNKVPPEAEQVD